MRMFAGNAAISFPVLATKANSGAVPVSTRRVAASHAVAQVFTA